MKVEFHLKIFYKIANFVFMSLLKQENLKDWRIVVENKVRPCTISMKIKFFFSAIWKEADGFIEAFLHQKYILPHGKSTRLDKSLARLRKK